jgi:hypothetical protein
MKKFQMGAFIALCIGIGTALGVAFNNIAMGVAFGAAIGAGLGPVFLPKDDQSNKS